MPSWAKRFMPRVLRSPMPSAWMTVRLRGWPLARNRFSTASCRQPASTRPPPPPISATVSPSLISATAASADMNLLMVTALFSDFPGSGLLQVGGLQPLHQGDHGVDGWACHTVLAGQPLHGAVD